MADGRDRQLRRQRDASDTQLIASRITRWRKPLLAVVVFFVALELVLQVGAVAAAIFVAPEQPAGAAAVLCAGDSFTFGVGATSAASSYPARLGAALAAHGVPGVAVANAGFPGQHSGDVLRKLRGQLTPATKVLCVMVGLNDSWRRPARVEPAELDGAAAATGFQWCWRTARLFQLLTRFDGGTWQRRGDESAMQLAAATGSEAPIPPSAQAAAPPTAAEITAGFAALAKCGLPAGSSRIGKYAPDRTLPAPRNDEFCRLMGAGDFARARECAERSAELHQQSPLALQQIVAAAARTGQRDVAKAALDRLARLCKQTPTPAANECLLQAYATCGEPELALAAARARIGDEPLSILAWDTLQQAAFVLDRRDDALRAMPETVRLLGRTDPARSAFIARNFARWFLDSDPQRAVGLLVGAHLVDGNSGETRISLMIAAEKIERRRFEDAIAAIAGPEHGATRALAAILDDVYAASGAEQWTATLREHLVAMSELAGRHGVQLVVLSYPFRQPLVEQAQRDAARALGVPFVAIRERFDDELRARPGAQLFVTEGHCSDDGYALVADAVAAAIAPLLRK